MKKTPLLITVAIILFVSGIIWVYQADRDRKITPWNLIGKDAAVVLEVSDLKVFFQKINSIGVIKQVISRQEGAELLMQANSSQAGNALIAFYPIQSDDFGLITFLETNWILADSGFSGAMNQLKQKYALKNRMYNGIEISEYWNKDKVIFSHAFIEDIFVMSASPFLLEGALRMRNEKGIQLFRNSNISAFRLPTLQADEGNLYINVANFFKASNIFFSSSASQDILSWTGSVASDIKINEQQFLMNGFLVDSVGRQSGLTLFRQQQPAVADLKNLISGRVAILAQYNMALPDKWFEDQQTFITQHHVLAQDSLWSALAQLGIADQAVKQAMGSQFASCYLV